jgi:hypothetical protein
MLTSRTGGFEVEGFEPNRYLVLWLRNHWCSISSVYILDPIDERTTRLIVRVRARFARRLGVLFFYPIFEVGDFLCMRKQLLNIKLRAESASKKGEQAAVAANSNPRGSR